MCLQGKGCRTSSRSEAKVAAKVGEGREPTELAAVPNPVGKQIPAHSGVSGGGSSRQPRVALRERGERGGPRIEGPRIGRRDERGSPRARGGATSGVPGRPGGEGPGTKNPKATLGGPGGV